MSLAKKSTLWLVAAIVVFALALTAFFAASPVTSASADTEVSTAVVVEASSSVNADTYPDLPYGTARTITAKYYFEVPASANEAQFFVAPVLVLPDNTTVKPTSITLNPALTDASIRFVSNYIAGTATFVDIDFDGPVVAGLTVSGETYTTVNNGYLFTATYDLANDAANGVYTFSLGSATEFSLGSSATEYMPSVVNGGSAEKKGSFNIRKAVTIPVADAEAEPYVYNGSEQTFAFTTASLVDAAYINFANNVKTDAGSYTVTASLKDPAGTAWVGNTTADQTYTFTIEKKQVTIPTAVANLVYTGSAQTGVTVDYTDYTKASGTIEETAAGDYSATFALKDTANTEWADAEVGEEITNKTIAWSIAKKSVTVPTPANVTYTFNKTAQSFQWAETPDALITITGTPQTDAGEYTITASIPANYAWNDEDHTTADKTFPFVIAKKSVTVPSLDASHFTYNGQEKSVALVQAVADEGYIAERSTGTTWFATNAGEYAVKVGLQYPDDTYWGNDTTDTADKTLNWDISKVQITKPTPYGNNQYVYDSYNKQFMLNTVTEETGYYTISNNIRRNAGSQTVTVSLKDKTNTEWADGTTTNLEFTLTVQKRPVNLSVSADAASHVYGNTPANVSISMTGAIDAFSCTYKVICVDGEAPYAEYTPTQFNAGLNVGHYTLNPVYNDINGNYDVTVSEPFSYEVIKREITIPTAISGLEYTGSAQDGVNVHGEAAFIELASGAASATAVGNYTATYSLKSTTNCYWEGDTTDVANKTVEWSIGKKQITKPSISASIKVYNGESQSNSGSGTGYTFTGSGTNVGEYPVTVSLTDKVNSVWAGTDSAEDYNEADKLIINKKTVKLTLTESADSSVYGDSIATITAGINPDYAPINAADIGTVSYTAKNFQTNVIYTKAEFETIRTAPVGNYILTAVCSVDNDNYSVDAQTLPYEITKRYITVPTVTTDTYPYDGQAHSIVFSGVDSTYVDVASVSETDIGTYPVAVSLKAAYAGNIAWDDDGYTTEAKGFTLTINSVNVSITFVGVYNNVQKVLAEDVELAVFTDLPTYAIRWFTFDGYTFDNAAVTQATLALDGQTVIATYLYNVGAGDVNGDGFVTTADVLMMKKYFVTLQDSFTEIATADAAWAATDDEVENPVFNTALDVNESGSFRSSDILAVREALATGYSYAIIVNPTATGVTGQAVIAMPERLTITSYDVDDAYGWNFVKAVKGGYPIALGADISAATKSFNEALVVPADIDLAGHTLTVNAFTMSNSAEDVTLKIWNSANTTGSIFTVEGISITAPNGNVIVSGVSGYSYEGTTVTLAAASSSLHVESNVGFYQYKIEGKANAQDYKASVTTDGAIDKDALDPEEGVIAITEAKVALMASKKATYEVNEAAKAELQEQMKDLNQQSAEYAELAEQYNAKVTANNTLSAQIDAIPVFKAPVSVPVDTHIVVEEGAKLEVEQVTVIAAQGANAATADTFSIDVKNTAAEVITVDIKAVKDTVNDVKYVNLAGDTSKVEIVKDAAQTIETTIGVKNEAELKAALVEGGAIKVGADFTVAQAIDVYKAFELDLNGYTISTSANRLFYIHAVNADFVGEGKFDFHDTNKDRCAIRIDAPGDKAAEIEVNFGEDLKIVSEQYPIGIFGPYVGGKMVAYGLTVNIDSTIVAESPAFATSGNIAQLDGDVVNGEPISALAHINIGSTANFTMAGGSRTAEEVAIYMGGFAVLNIEAGARLTGPTALYIKSGYVTIEDGVILKATKATTADYRFYGNGCYATGDAIVIDNCYYPGANAVVTNNASLNDITVTAEGAKKVATYWAVSNETELKAAVSANASYIYIKNDFALTSTVSISGGKHVYINMNGRTISSSDKTMFSVYAGNSLEFGGTGTLCFTSAATKRAAMWIEGSTNVASVRASYLTVGEGITITSTGYGLVLYEVTGTNYCYGVVMTVNGTISSYNAAICAIGNIAQHTGDVVDDEPIDSISEINVGSTAVLSATNSSGIYAAGFAILNIASGAELSGPCALYIKSGFVTIGDDAVLTATKESLKSYEYYGNGDIPTGDGVVIDCCYYPGKAPVVTYNDALLDNITVTADGAQKVATYWAVSTEEQLREALAANAPYVYFKNDITVTGTTAADRLTVKSDVTIDLNGKTLKSADGLEPTSNWATLWVNNGAVANIKNGTIGSCYDTDGVTEAPYGINVGIFQGTPGTVNLTNVNVYGATTAVQVTYGTLNIYSGYFQAAPYEGAYTYLINCKDEYYQAGTAVINIYGGSFYRYDPSGNAAEGPYTNFCAAGYTTTEEDGVYEVRLLEIEITTFAELSAAIANVNNGTLVNPTLRIMNDIAFEEELTISKSVTIKGDGTTKFIGYDASTKYDEAFYINVADEDQEITIDGIVFDHFCYYSNVANKTKATAAAVKNGVAYITYGGNCPASTTLYITDCRFLGTARDMINASSTIGCKGFIVIEDCYFDATDRLSSTLNMLSFYGNADAELSVIITGCTFKEASEQNATWATSAIASFGNADLTITGCEFIACQIGIAIDNTFDRLYSTVTYPVTYNTTVTYSDITYTNCYFGYFGEFFVEDASEIPEDAELYTDEPFTYGDNAATQFHFAAEYDVYEAGEAGEAQHRIYLCYYVKAMTAVGGGEGAQGDPGLED